VTIKLRLQALDPQRSLSDLLAVQAPHYSPEQAQNALFYHMAEAGYLQLAGQVVRPQAAYVEMTTQRDQSLDIVFVFALPRKELRSEATVHFVVDKAFFLSQPVGFTLPSAQLLAS
jgi:hypothetical protein